MIPFVFLRGLMVLPRPRWKMSTFEVVAQAERQIRVVQSARQSIRIPAEVVMGYKQNKVSTIR